MSSQGPEKQGSGVRGQGSVEAAEHVQALDFHHNEGIIRVALIDSLSGVIITEAVSNNYGLVKAATNFLQRAWAGGAPEVLAVDCSPVFQTRNFRSFVEGQGVKLRILSPADVKLRGKLERTYLSRAAV
jgi:hypothetical protein